MAKNKVGILIQARMGSTRLPKKMAMLLQERPLIQWVLEGAKSSKLADQVILCTSNLQRDDYLADKAKKHGVEVFRGNEQNVLKRFVDAACLFEIDTVIRVCGDNPFLNGQAIDELIHFFQSHEKIDYSFNHIPSLNNNWPDGFGVEITKRSTLSEIFNDPTCNLSHQEHVTSFIWSNKEKYNFVTFKSSFENNYETVKLDIDTREDFQSIENFLNYLKSKKIPLDDMNLVCHHYMIFFKLKTV